MKNPLKGHVVLTLFFSAFLLGHVRAAQPVILQNIGDRIVPTNAPSLSINLTQYVRADPATNLVRVITSLTGISGIPLGFTLQLFPSNAPKTVSNFLAYVNDGAYENMLIHRSVPGFVIQTGGYEYDGTTIPVWTNIVPSEYGLSNIRGTVAMALSGSDSNSATDQWFINLTNNSSTLDDTNTANIPVYGTNNSITFTRNPPFTVFAKVIGNGMQVVDSIAQCPTINLGSPFDTLPVLSTNTTSLTALTNLVHISRVATIPYFPLSSDSTAYSPRISNSTLFIDYTGGTNPPSNPVTISVFAYDTNGLTTNSSFQVWYRTNATRTINYPQYSNQYYSPNGFNMGFYPYSSDGTAIPASNISWVGPAVFTGYTNGYNHFAFTGVGTVTFTYVQPGNVFYKPITNTSQFIVSAAPQTITFPQIPDQLFSTNPFLLTTYSPSSSSGLPISISIKPGSPMTVLNNKFYMTGVGTVTLIANQSGTNVYLPAQPKTNTFAISPGPQTITFPAISNKVLPVKPFAISANASSGLPLTYSLSSNSPATLTNGNTLRITGPGTITVVAKQTGTNAYLPATPVTNSFRAASNQTIGAFVSIPNRTYTNPSATLTINPMPKSSSGLLVSLSVKSGPASLLSTNSNSASFSITGAGTITLAANQPGNSNYFAAPEVTTSFKVAKANQSFSKFPNLPTSITNGTPVTINLPILSSGLTNITLSASGAGYATSSNTVIPTNKGTLNLTASSVGDSNYLATSITTNIPVVKGSQTITFPSIDSPLMAGTNHYGLSAAASSGLPVTYTLTPLKANVSLISNAIVVNAYTSNNSDSYTVVASQAGNSGWLPATPVTNTFTTAPYDSGSSGGSITVNGGSYNSYIGSDSVDSGNLTLTANGDSSHTTPTPTPTP